jgi:hypothetical protein
MYPVLQELLNPFVSVNAEYTDVVEYPWHLHRKSWYRYYLSRKCRPSTIMDPGYLQHPIRFTKDFLGP